MEFSDLSLPKRKNCHTAECSEDRISGLVDEILCYILSFLPTKYAVLTSILSKRWQYLWTCITILDFDDRLRFNPHSRLSSTRNCFTNFVNRVLILRDNYSRVTTFCIKCCQDYNPCDINTWICFAVALGAREIDLSYHHTPNYVTLPRNLFTCEKLEMLKLTRDFIICLPKSIRLFNLRVLHLVMIVPLSGSSVEKLICSCPVLVELVVERASFDSLKTLAIRSFSLKSLRLRARMGNRNDCSIIIDAPNLECFDLSHVISKAYKMCSFPLLVKANIDVVEFFEEHNHITDVHENNLHELLVGISNVRHLSLSSMTMNNLDLAVKIAMPQLHNLTRLEITIERYGWRIMSELLKCAPCLKEFVFVKEYKKVMKHLWYFPKCNPKCLPMLEMVEIKGFEGHQPEMELATYFLESATVLRKMIIYTRDMDFTQKLIVLDTLTSTRCSEICEIVLRDA